MSSKEDFVGILKYGKCKCGKPAQKGHLCPASGAKHCPCCEECTQSCLKFVNEMVERLSKTVQEEIDAEVIEGIKKMDMTK